MEVDILFLKKKLKSKGDEFAAKSAAHEILCVNSLIGCGIPRLHFPFMTVVDYLGLRKIFFSIQCVNCP
jgi:hypothetical protein